MLKDCTIGAIAGVRNNENKALGKGLYVVRLFKLSAGGDGSLPFSK